MFGIKRIAQPVKTAANLATAALIIAIMTFFFVVSR